MSLNSLVIWDTRMLFSLSRMMSRISAASILHRTNKFISGLFRVSLSFASSIDYLDCFSPFESFMAKWISNFNILNIQGTIFFRFSIVFQKPKFNVAFSIYRNVSMFLSCSMLSGSKIILNSGSSTSLMLLILVM